MDKNQENQEAMEKSQIDDTLIDSLIDEVFMKSDSEENPETSSEEDLEKAKSSAMADGSSADDPKSPKTADEGEKPKKPKSEEEDERGRPKEVSDVPDTDTDGNRAKGYDHIQKPNSETPKTSAKGTVVKSFTISEEDYELLQKAKADQKEEALQKAKQEQADLMKSIVNEAVDRAAQEKNAEIEELKKSLDETKNLVKLMADQPNPSKAVTNVQAIEKSFKDIDNDGEEKPQVQRLSKSQMMDVAEDLVKSKELTDEQFIELDDTGYIFDAQARKRLEQACAKKFTGQ